MALIRINIGFPPALLKALDKYAEEHGLDRSNAVRFCVSLAIEEEAKRKRENSIA